MDSECIRGGHGGYNKRSLDWIVNIEVLEIMVVSLGTPVVSKLACYLHSMWEESGQINEAWARSWL